MSIPKNRSYKSESRQTQSLRTKNRILASAKMLFESKGFEGAIIEESAREAQVSAPLIYSIFQSKRGVIQPLLSFSEGNRPFFSAN